MQNNRHIIIAIDGPSGTGKSTTAKSSLRIWVSPTSYRAMYRANYACRAQKRKFLRRRSGA